MFLVPIQEAARRRRCGVGGVYSLICVLMAVLLCAGLGYAQVPCPSIDVFFSPKGGCSDAIVREITNAKSTVLVQAYSVESDQIRQGLLVAHKRGVKVNVILDKKRSGRNYTEADFFLNHGIEVRIDSVHKIAHDKVIVIDGGTVITGSFNFSKIGEVSNAENVVIIRDEKLAEKYADNWRIHWGHSQPYKGKNSR